MTNNWCKVLRNSECRSEYYLFRFNVKDLCNWIVISVVNTNRSKERINKH